MAALEGAAIIGSPRQRISSRVHNLLAAVGLVVVVSVVLAAVPTPAFAATTAPTPPAVSLGSAASYLVLGQGGVTSTGATVVSGDVGVGKGSSLVGFPPGLVGGETHTGDAAATQALTDATAAYADAKTRTFTGALTGASGQIFTAGVFHTDAALALTGTLTLDAQNNPDAVFLFQVGGAFTTAAASHIVLTNGAFASHVFWQVTGAVDLGASSTFVGTILGGAAITTGAGTRISGRALSQATVTLANNTYTFTSTDPPHITIDGGDRSFSPGHTPTLTGTVTTTVTSTATVTVTIAGQTLTATVAGGSGNWSVTAAPITDGTYPVRAAVTDPVGNRASATQLFIVGRNAGPVPLGTATTYAVFGGGGVTSTGTTVVAGDLGTSPATTITGFPPGIIGGTTHLNDAAAIQARTDLDAAYADAKTRTFTGPVTGASGQTFTGGVFHTDVALALTGTLTLDAQNNPDAVFLFQIGGAFSTAAASHIVLTNGALASRVFWQAAGAVDLGASSSFAGTILAAGAITTGAGTRISGRALSQATVTLANNTYTFTNAGPPHITIDGGDRSFNPSHTPTLTGTVTTTVTTDAAVTVTIAGQTLTTTVAGGSGNWSVTAATITDGTYPVRAAVTDPVGNQASATQTFIVGRNAGPVPLGTATTYAVFGGGGVTSTGNTSVSGDLGTSPSNTVTADPAINVGGETHLNDAAAIQARTDLDTAYTDAKTRDYTRLLTGDLNGQTLTAGVFHTDAALALTGTLTLDALNNPDAVFLFQIGGAFSTAAASHIVLTNGALASHVFWQTTGAANLGANSTFAGNLLAAGALNVGASARIGGSAFSQTTVTLANNVATFSDASPPNITIDGGDRSFSPGHTPTLTGTVTTSVTSDATVTVTIAGQTLTATVAGGSGSWSVTATTIADGTYPVRAAVTDPVGNRSSATQTFSVGRNAGLVPLRTAASFSVLGGGGVSSTNNTTLSGDLGTSPSDTVTADPAINVGGETHLNDAVAIQARTDLDTAYADAKARTPTRLFAGTQAGKTFTAGVFHTDAAFALTGTLTLDAQNNPDAVFLFQIGGAFTTAAASTIVLTNGALASHVFWQTTGAASLGANSTFVGTILGGAAITAGDAATFDGRLLGVGVVTFSNNTITNPPPDPPRTPTGTLTITTPTTANLGAVVNSESSQTVSGHLGRVTVTDTRDLPQGAGWVANVTAGPFNPDVTGPAIPASAVGYNTGIITSDVSATYDAPPLSDLTSAQPAVSTNAAGANTAHWNPTITVAVPGDSTVATYTTTITHSVA